MKIDVRVSNIQEFKNIHDVPCDTVSIGDEYCYYRLPDSKELGSIIKECVKSGKEWKIVTPFFTNASCDNFINTFSELLQEYEKINVVINDYGFLDKLMTKTDINRFNVTIGLMLAQSYAEFPWAEMSLKEESEYIKKSWLLNGLANTHAIRHLKSICNLKTIELNYLESSLASAEFFKSEGLNVEFVENYYPISVTRNCHTARFHNDTRKEDCIKRCNKGYRIHATRMWVSESFGEKYVDVPKGIQDRGNDMYVFGNAVYCKYKDKMDIQKYPEEKVILDYRFYMDDITELKKKAIYYKG